MTSYFSSDIPYLNEDNFAYPIDIASPQLDFIPRISVTKFAEKESYSLSIKTGHEFVLLTSHALLYQYLLYQRFDECLDMEEVMALPPIVFKLNYSHLSHYRKFDDIIFDDEWVNPMKASTLLPLKFKKYLEFARDNKDREIIFDAGKFSRFKVVREISNKYGPWGPLEYELEKIIRP